MHRHLNLKNRFVLLEVESRKVPLPLSEQTLPPSPFLQHISLQTIPHLEGLSPLPPSIPCHSPLLNPSLSFTPPTFNQTQPVCLSSLLPFHNWRSFIQSFPLLSSQIYLSTPPSQWILLSICPGANRGERVCMCECIFVCTEGLWHYGWLHLGGLLTEHAPGL